uniref:PDZ domain-containing protein n=1 Tax=Glossina brevipalpis TaxID=37001 RepID=A0A1A9WAY3_9MUSC
MHVEMATALLTDCSNSLRESTTSSSSDMLTLTTSASSWCAFSVSSRIRMVRLIRPHMRRILVVPGTTPTFGFTVRGGKEFGTGFFVSSVDRNSEAEQKGLKIGDQILCVNGFKIDDAIHKEFMQLVLRQDRLVLKVRSLGMLPVKQRENSDLYWSAVKTPAVVYNAAHPESSYQSSLKRDKRILNEREVHIVLNVAPKTKLGLGICKGPEWKPGIFVQFTKDKSVARDAGLKPGDQILSVNSIDFADVLFSEAVAVMRSSNKLDMMIRTKVGCDLFPGESSGYNSSASSITGDQSPCWADVKSKRLISVKEEITPLTPSSTTKHWENISQTVGKQSLTSTVNDEANIFESKVDGPEVNKTIIKLLDNGTLINNKMLDNNNSTTNPSTITPKNWDCATTNKDDILKAPPPPPPPLTNITDSRGKFEIQTEMKCEKTNDEDYGCNRLKRNGGIAATMQRYQNLRNTNANMSSALPTLQKVIHKFQTTTATTTSEKKPTISSLSNAISEELKKRKAKQQTCPANESSFSSTPLSKSNTCNRPCNNNPLPNTETALNITHLVNGYQHSAFINEFKEAHKRMFKNGFKENDNSKTETGQEDVQWPLSSETDAGIISPNTFSKQPQRILNNQLPNEQLSHNALKGDYKSSARYVFNRERCNELSPTDNDNTQIQQQLHKISHNIQHYELSLNSNIATENKKTMRMHMAQIGEYENQSTIQQTMMRREVLRDEVCHYKAETMKDSQIEERNHNYQREKSQEGCKEIDRSNGNKFENSSSIYAAVRKTNYPVDISSGPGILKNGNRLNTTNTATKSLEKSIKFV